MFDWQLLRIAAPWPGGFRRQAVGVLSSSLACLAPCLCLLQDGGRGVSQHATIWYCWHLNNERCCDSNLFFYTTSLSCPQKYVMLYVTEKKKNYEQFFFRINLAALNKDIDSCYRIKYSITVNAEGWKRTCEVYHLLLVQRYMKHSSHISHFQTCWST